MKSMSIDLSLSVCGATRASVDGTPGTICVATGYIRSDTHCVMAGRFLVTTRRMLIEARHDATAAQRTARARAEVLAHDVWRADSALAAKISGAAQDSSIWKSVEGMLHSFFSWLCTLSRSTVLPATHADALALLDRFITIHRLGAK